MGTISVPVTLINLNDDGFHLLVEIVAFGQKNWAVVDTGASRSVFDRNFITQYTEGVENEEESSATTLFSTANTVQAIIPVVKIGKLKLKSYHCVALDLETVNETYMLLGHPRIIAILGSDIFYSYQAKINYKKLTISFAKKSN
ncbi:MAG: retropepsin-like domain-containing protein [Pedobacter sp.]|nr:retropepsin-like domain-containing protein [Pedobacter sp.]